MKKLLIFALPLLLVSVALGQAIPPCDPNNPGPNCTDYFGIANWANSPLPSGPIASFTVLLQGSGYANPVFVVTDLTGSGTGAAAPTFTLQNGAITAVSGGGGGSGYIIPQVTVVDLGPNGTLNAPTCGGFNQPACGSGAIITASINGTGVSGGMRKFVDQLPSLSIAVPDTTTFPGSDYYVIALVEYSQKLHSDLPATKLRGYVQLNNGTDVNGNNNVAPAAPSYLGPVIIAQKNRPVRVLFMNQLPIGAGGNLFIPVDTTYMGAGPPYTQNRATLHLHGGATPWISDGTPHQWTAPKGESGPARGDSVQFVPDMWFDSTNNSLIASCAGKGTCTAPNATNDPGAGNLTFFWTNQQGGRLMFYHDHAYGLTRLNVYAGEAAGYLLYDPAEENALAAANVPGTIARDTKHLIPLVIQDKTFVPSAAQLNATDPTWTVGGWGTTPGSANPGDLWFPHIYTPNQNPSDPGGANAFGRWDYGPWTLPGNQTSLLAANPNEAVNLPCTSSAYPNQVVLCPITPNPSGTPEGFMDTPLVNGAAYPVLHVAPEAYRFKILSAGNDRSWNLQLYVADPTVTTPDNRTNTEVKMVPAIQPGTGSALPLCSQITPITNTMLFMGLATAILDPSGNPINGTGLPAGCWPTFGTGSQTAGIPVQQTMWPADGRAGGVPDPTTAGPPFIQIGSEGGLLPAPVVIPSMPTGYEANTRSVTITNVSVHGLWIGPAERADVIVDFSKFAGKTLILYNDAPAPAPAMDSRVDYFTNDGDQSVIGGAPNTLPGYGPNTRTIMQIVVDQNPTPNLPPFSVAYLKSTLPSIFAQTQPVPIVPEPTYPPASGGYAPSVTYSRISDNSLTFFPVGSTKSVTINDDRKTIQELFTLDYGRMNATLGVELPLTNFLTQTTIPLGYIDPPTEIIDQGATQLWHITHNGVDTHFIHFHLFNVQVINRSGWDGSIRPPDQNELGWKDTVRMNPLEDILVALQPITPVLPFPVPDSYRMLDVTMMAGSDCPASAPGQPSPLPCSIFTDVNPATNNPANTPNTVQDFGWEYVWHCHILGHEENDMMRAIVFNVPPESPANLTVQPASGGGLTLTWTDTSASETGFTLERADDAGFTKNIVDTPISPLNPDANGQGITWGETVTYNDTGAGPGPYFYRVKAFKPRADNVYFGTPATLNSGWSNTAFFGPTVAVSPAALDFGTVSLTVASQNQMVTIANSGTAPVTYSASVSPAGAFTVADPTCGGTVPAASSCTLNVTFTPTVAGSQSATLSFTTTDLSNPNPTVTLTGIGGTALPLLTITASNSTMKYGGTVPLISPIFNPPNPSGVTGVTCTTTATSTSAVGNYQTICSGASGNYTFNYVAGTIAVTPVPLTIWASNAAMQVGSTPPAITPLYVGFVAGDSASTLATAPNVAPTCTTTATSTSPVGKYPSTCTGAVDPNYTISYVNGTVTVSTGTLTVTAPSFSMTYGGPVPTNLTPTYTSNGVPVVPIAPFTPPVCTTSATVKSAVGTYSGAVICSGAADPNYAITYVAGDVTVTPAPLVVTAPSPTMTYGGPVPTLTPSYATFVAGDTAASLTTQPTCTTTATSTSPVGTYPVTCSGAVDNNYTISYVGGTLTVAPATLTVTASSGTMTYGGQIPPISPIFSGFVNGETSSVLTTQPTCSTTATGTSPVSGPTYPSSCMGAVASNYTINYVSGAITVNPAPLVITASSASMTYGGPVPAITPNFSGFVNGQNSSVLTTQPTCSTTATSTSPVSGPTYPTSCTGAVAPNYTITYVSGAITVNPAPLLITASSGSMIYGGPLPAISPIFSGFVNGQNSSVLTTQPTCSTTATSTSPASPPTYVSSCMGAAAANYTIAYAAGSVTINKANSTTTIISNLPNPSIYGQQVTVSFRVSALTGFLGTPTGGTATVRASTGETCSAVVSNGGGSCNLVFLTGGPRTITASYGGDSNFLASPASAGVTQTVSSVNLSSTSLVFGSQLVGTASTRQTVTLTNTGPTALAMTSITITGANAGDFTQTNNCPLGTTLAAGRSCSINVTFRPSAVGIRSASVSIADGDFTSPQSVALTGTGVQPSAVLTPTSWNFGSVTRRTQSTPFAFTLSNPSSTYAGPLTINNISIGGANAGQFTVSSTTCGTTLQIGASCTINVVFAPTGRGAFTATLNISDNAPGSPQTAALSGTGQ